VKESINTFASIGSSILYAKNKIVVFGNPPNDDLIVEQKYLKKLPSKLLKSGIEQKIDTRFLDELADKVQLLTYSDAVAQFFINADLLEKIKKVIEDYSSTHLRMFTHNGKLRFFIFDCRMSDQKLRVSRRNSLQLHYIDVAIQIKKDFTFTIKSNTFKKIPKDDYAVRVGENGICSFTPAKKNIRFLIRDQELSEPLVTFQSPLLDAQIVFAPAPNF